MQTRKRNSRPTWDIDMEGTVFNEVAGNYYPLNAVATIRTTCAPVHQFVYVFGWSTLAELL